jgi:hypothetical protein
MFVRDYSLTYGLLSEIWNEDQSITKYLCGPPASPVASVSVPVPEAAPPREEGGGGVGQVVHVDGDGLDIVRGARSVRHARVVDRDVAQVSAVCDALEHQLGNNSEIVQVCTRVRKFITQR